MLKLEMSTVLKAFATIRFFQVLYNKARKIARAFFGRGGDVASHRVQEELLDEVWGN